MSLEYNSRMFILRHSLQAQKKICNICSINSCSRLICSVANRWQTVKKTYEKKRFQLRQQEKQVSEKQHLSLQLYKKIAIFEQEKIVNENVISLSHLNKRQKILTNI